MVGLPLENAHPQGVARFNQLADCIQPGSDVVSLNLEFDFRSRIGGRGQVGQFFVAEELLVDELSLIALLDPFLFLADEFADQVANVVAIISDFLGCAFDQIIILNAVFHEFDFAQRDGLCGPQLNGQSGQ